MPSSKLPTEAIDAALEHVRAAGWTPTKAESIPVDPWTFIKECVSTQDEHSKALGLPYIRPLVSRLGPPGDAPPVKPAVETGALPIGIKYPSPPDTSKSGVQQTAQICPVSGKESTAEGVTKQDSACPISVIGSPGEVAEGEEYLRLITEAVSRESMLRVEKSRQLRVTWLLTALMVHRVMVDPGTKVGYAAKKFDDADLYLRDRFWFIYEHIPTKYKKPSARYISGRIEVFHDEGTTIPTSQVMALAEGAEQVRQNTFTVLWADEFAFQEHQEEMLTAAKPTTDGGGQIILTSSANGDQNMFYELGHEDFVKGGAKEPVVELGMGVRRWKRNGWTTLRVHYLADGHKRGDWASKAKIGYPSRAWQQEQEIDFSIQPGQAVYCDTEKLRVTSQVYVAGFHLWRGWDFGFRYPFVVFAQVRPIYDERGNFLRDRLYFIEEITIPDSSTEQMAELVNIHTQENYFRATIKDCCDFYGGNQRTSRNPLTDVQILRANGIVALCSPEHVKTGVEILQKLISQGEVEVDPDRCPTLLTALRSGYCRGDNGELPNDIAKEKQHPYCDVADAARYLAQMAFRFENLQKRGPMSKRGETMTDQARRLGLPMIPRGRSGGTIGVDKNELYEQKGNVRRLKRPDYLGEFGERGR